MLCDVIGVVQVADAHVCIVAAAENRGVENAADRAAPDVEALSDVLCQFVDARQEVQRIVKEQRRGRKGKQGGEVGDAPLFLAALEQHDRTYDQKHDVGCAAFRELERKQIERDQRRVSDLHAAAFALHDIVDAEEDDKGNVKCVVVRIRKNRAVARAVGPAHAEPALNQRNQETVGAHKADEGEDDPKHPLRHRVGDEDHRAEGENHEYPEQNIHHRSA